ncbi:hypothetical protein Taro_021791, partial [Colocasia esculenta]|nr:hypothetical protein [Colocasia esculenta]
MGLAGLAWSGVNRGGLCRRILDATPSAGVTPLLSRRIAPNTVNMTVELSSFGRPKEEKLKPHLCPLREAATITWSKHSLGYSQRGQPATHHRQRETSDVREPPEDIHSRHGDNAEAKRIVHSLFSGDHGGTSSAATVIVFIQVDGKRSCRQP